MTDTSVCFFLGANTPKGFYGYASEAYDPLDGWRVYLIKSGAGTGKSTLMKRLLHDMTALGAESEVLRCSSDPLSLDGILFPAVKMGIFDATAPHIIEPRYWGACEQIVNLAGCMDEEQMAADAPTIIGLTEACHALHARCCRYISAAAQLMHDNERLALACTDTDKIRALAARIARREFDGDAEHGRESCRFLSAITPEGPLMFENTLQALCPRIYALEDDTGAAAPLLLSELRRLALEKKFDIISCHCPLSPEDKQEHLLIPTLGLGFTTSGTFHKVDFPVYRRIHASRFQDAEALRKVRQRLSFNKRSSKELLREAVACMIRAKETHDRLEQFSITHMDWKKASAISEEISHLFTTAYRRHLAGKE